MLKLVESFDQKLPFMIGIVGGKKVVNNTAEVIKKHEMKLTIFYNDIFQNRKFLTCLLKCNNVSNNVINDIKIVIDGNEETINALIPDSTVVGDLIAYLRHSLIPDSTIQNNSELISIQDSNFISKNSTDQKCLQLMDSSSTISDLMARPLHKGIIMIRDRQDLLCALVSNEELTSQHTVFTESYSLIEKISNEITLLMKNAMPEFNFNNLNSDPEKKNSWLINQKWLAYVQFFESETAKSRISSKVEMQLFIELLKEIKRIVNLLYVNHQVFLSDKDKSLLRDTVSYLIKLKEIENNTELNN